MGKNDLTIVGLLHQLALEIFVYCKRYGNQVEGDSTALCLAQLLWESGFGTKNHPMGSRHARLANNWFGIKLSQHPDNQTFQTGRHLSVDGVHCGYLSIRDCFLDRVDKLLMHKRWMEKRGLTWDIESGLETYWHPDPKYYDNLQRVIKVRNLERFNDPRVIQAADERDENRKALEDEPRLYAYDPDNPSGTDPDTFVLTQGDPRDAQHPGQQALRGAGFQPGWERTIFGTLVGAVLMGGIARLATGGFAGLGNLGGAGKLLEGGELPKLIHQVLGAIIEAEHVPGVEAKSDPGKFKESFATALLGGLLPAADASREMGFILPILNGLFGKGKQGWGSLFRPDGSSRESLGQRLLADVIRAAAARYLKVDL